MCPYFIEYVPKQPCHIDNNVEGGYPSTQKEVEQHEEKGKLINV